MEIKTIDLITFSGEEVTCVRLSDYAKLQAEVERLAAEKAELRRALEEILSETGEDGIHETARAALKKGEGK